MARSFTLSTLVTRAKQRAEMENASFISDPEWKGIISSAYAELYSILVASGMRYFESVDSVATDGNSAYALPADFLASIGVDYVVNAQGERRALEELMVQERNYTAGVTGAGESFAYALVGANLELYPTPPSGQTYEHRYVPQPADLSEAADGTSVDVVTPDGEQFLIWYAAVMALSKEESDVQVAMAERERFRQRVEEWAVMRALNSPRRPIVGDDDSYWDPAEYRRGGW